jgi:hypothetical protein
MPRDSFWFPDVEEALGFVARRDSFWFPDVEEALGFVSMIRTNMRTAVSIDLLKI